MGILKGMPTSTLANPKLQDTVDAMVKLAKEGRKDLSVLATVQTLCAQVQRSDYCSEVYAIYAWVDKNIRYMRDIHDVETLQSPKNLLASKSGDCDDIATLLASMLMAAGSPCRFCVVSFTPNNPSHVFCQAYVGGSWVTVDPVAAQLTQEMHGKVVELKVCPI